MSLDTPKSRYDSDLQVFSETPDVPRRANLCFDRWLADGERLEHAEFRPLTGKWAPSRTRLPNAGHGIPPVARTHPMLHPFMVEINAHHRREWLLVEKAKARMAPAGKHVHFAEALRAIMIGKYRSQRIKRRHAELCTFARSRRGPVGARSLTDMRGIVSPPDLLAACLADGRVWGMRHA